MMIYSGLHDAYIHIMRKFYLWECNMIVMPIDAGEQWLLIGTDMSYAGGWQLR